MMLRSTTISDEPRESGLTPVWLSTAWRFGSVEDELLSSFVDKSSNPPYLT
jgi:hypothetical protein